MLWAETDGQMGGIIAAFVASFGGMAALMGWLIRYFFTTTLPEQIRAAQATHVATLEEFARLREQFDLRQTKLLEHCEAEADKERQASERRQSQSDQRFGTAMDALKEIQQSILNQNAIQAQLLSLFRQRTRLSDVVESAEDPIWSKTLDGVLTSWNSAAERLLGWRSSQMIGRSAYGIIPAEGHERERELLGQLARGERVDRYETERIHRDGRRVRLSITASPIKDPTGRVIGISSIAREL
jgi:PAS domain S-box-containing protein